LQSILFPNQTTVKGVFKYACEIGLIDQPVRITYRRSMWDGLVVQFYNTSDRNLLLEVSCRSSKSNESGSSIVRLKPHDMTEQEVLETGWVFYPGETVKVTHEDYQALKVTAPK